MKLALAALALFLPSLAFGAVGVVDAGGEAFDEPTRARLRSTLADELVERPLAAEGPWIGHGAELAAVQTGGTVELAIAVGEARARLGALQTAAARKTLIAALADAPGSPSAVSTKHLAAALELLGQTAQDEGDDAAATDAYERLLTFAPSYSLSTPPGMGYEDLFNRVRVKMNTLREGMLAIQHDLDEVHWDGEPIPAGWSGSRSVRPGEHLLQWLDDNTRHGVLVTVQGGGMVSIVATASLPRLLGEGASDEGRRVALTPILQELAGELPAIAVVQGRDPLRGYTLRDTVFESWSGGVAVAPSTSSDRARFAVGGGYGLVDGSHYGEVTGALDIGLVGPLSLRIDGGLGVSEPLDFGVDHELTGKVALLPGVGAGVVIRKPDGPAQPWVGLSLGVSISPPTLREEAEAEARTLDPELAERLDARGPVAFRGYLDGGLDLAPPGPLLVRVFGGVGYGLGLQVRAGAQVGFRFGGAK